MPTLRILADGTRPVYASNGVPDRWSVPSFQVQAGDTVLCVVDYTGWLGGATISSSNWTTEATLSGEAISGQTVTVLAEMPEGNELGASVMLKNRIIASDGRAKVAQMRLYVTDVVIGDNYLVGDGGAILA